MEEMKIILFPDKKYLFWEKKECEQKEWIRWEFEHQISNRDDSQMAKANFIICEDSWSGIKVKKVYKKNKKEI